MTPSELDSLKRTMFALLTRVIRQPATEHDFVTALQICAIREGRFLTLAEQRAVPQCLAQLEQEQRIRKDWLGTYREDRRPDRGSREAQLLARRCLQLYSGR